MSTSLPKTGCPSLRPEPVATSTTTMNPPAFVPSCGCQARPEDSQLLLTSVIVMEPFLTRIGGSSGMAYLL